MLPAGDRTPAAAQIARQCVCRRGQPDDVAAAGALFASPQAAFITGQSLYADCPSSGCGFDVAGGDAAK
ncbi:SDR family oxidoreductase [Nonomuraea ceibae]|uniref:SDR family oxidoreductase n=1 Tax=Nonomuraea ceibae TaxID=1935170 RepID=UPI001FE9C055|nr:SDR family oxidoreductase [Nonomuraea ceibae]